MNDAHLHLVVNHFPIIGGIFGLGILILSLILKNKSVQNVAYGLFIVCAIFGAISMSTGEGAEEIVEKLPNVTHQIIHEHEEMAEKLAIILYVLGAVSLIGFYLNIKNHQKSTIISYFVVLISVVSIFFGKQTGTTGGEIRHTEIRSDSNTELPVTKDENDSHED
jgi:uncharacterized membrane protein